MRGLMGMLVVAGLGALARPSAAACEALHAKADLARALAATETSYSAMDLESFRTGLDGAARLLPCLGEPLPPEMIAHYHRLQGLQAGLVRDDARAQQAFLAARRIDPDYRFPEEFIPESHPIRLQYAALPLEGITYEEVPPLRTGSLLIDGRKGDQRPANAPTLVQLLDETGQVQKTAYLWPGSPLPFPPGGGESPPAALSRPLLWLAGGSALAAAGLTVVAWRGSEAYAEAGTVDDLERLRSLTNISNGAALGLWAVAGGAGVGAVVAGRW